MDVEAEVRRTGAGEAVAEFGELGGDVLEAMFV